MFLSESIFFDFFILIELQVSMVMMFMTAVINVSPSMWMSQPLDGVTA